eukprot:snap_masked-scaffold_14-processed-gene-11.47-mRNA-1 protein AED:1.00 eAED:1.00 QI:0/-1/0/0/-1/1/1/0/501
MNSEENVSLQVIDPLRYKKSEAYIMNLSKNINFEEVKLKLIKDYPGFAEPKPEVKDLRLILTGKIPKNEEPLSKYLANNRNSITFVHLVYPSAFSKKVTQEISPNTDLGSTLRKVETDSNISRKELTLNKIKSELSELRSSLYNIESVESYEAAYKRFEEAQDKLFKSIHLGFKLGMVARSYPSMGNIHPQSQFLNNFLRVQRQTRQQQFSDILTEETRRIRVVPVSQNIAAEQPADVERNGLRRRNRVNIPGVLEDQPEQQGHARNPEEVLINNDQLAEAIAEPNVRGRVFHLALNINLGRFFNAGLLLKMLFLFYILGGDNIFKLTFEDEDQPQRREPEQFTFEIFGYGVDIFDKDTIFIFSLMILYYLYATGLAADIGYRIYTNFFSQRVHNVGEVTTPNTRFLRVPVQGAADVPFSLWTLSTDVLVFWKTLFLSFLPFYKVLPLEEDRIVDPEVSISEEAESLLNNEDPTRTEAREEVPEEEIDRREHIVVEGQNML